MTKDINTIAHEIKETDKIYKELIKQRVTRLRSAWDMCVAAYRLRGIHYTYVFPQPVITVRSVNGYFCPTVVVALTTENNDPSQWVEGFINNLLNDSAWKRETRLLREVAVNNYAHAVFLVFNPYTVNTLFVRLQKTGSNEFIVATYTSSYSSDALYADSPAVNLLCETIDDLIQFVTEKRDELIRTHYELLMSDPLTEHLKALVSYENL